MKQAIFVLTLFSLAPSVRAQLSANQKLADFRYLADLYATKYAPYEWKRAAIPFDAMEIAPWLDRVTRSKDDLEFLDLCVEYVASLNDAHDAFYLPSSFEASLPFSADIYDGKVLIDVIERDQLPQASFPFEIGDELVSVDGRSADELLNAFQKYSTAANPRSTRRIAAESICDRWQALMPRAHEIGNEATVVVRRQGGAVETYSIRWQKSGTPVTILAPRLSPHATAGRQLARRQDPDSPSPVGALKKMQNFVLRERRFVVGMGELTPVFALPASFEQRLGKNKYDSYYSGTFKADAFTIGYIRVPDFFGYTKDFEQEIRFFQTNTDGLVVDIMRNPGGSVCNAEVLGTYLIPTRFQTLAEEVRVTWSDILGMADAVEEAVNEGASSTVIDQLFSLRKEFETAYRERNGRTVPLPICASSLDRDPAKDTKTGEMIAYTKPILVLVDEMTASSGDYFAALMQDNQRALLFGMRTMGAGGSPETLAAGAYSEGFADVTRTIVVRKAPVVTPEYPTAPYLENIGVRPELVSDYMTLDNLLNQGRSFVEAFTASIVNTIKTSKGL